MKYTRYENKKLLKESDEILGWLQNNVDAIPKDKPLFVFIIYEMDNKIFTINRDGIIKELNIDKQLTNTQKKIITDKFSELEDKEVG